MSSWYHTDQIELITVTEDPETGVQKTKKKKISCRFENKNKLLTNSQGQDVRIGTWIAIDGKVKVKPGDKYRILKKFGETFYDKTRTFQAKIVFRNACFGPGVTEIGHQTDS